MTNLRRALQHARNILWEILVQHGKGELTMSEDMRRHVDQAERIATEALEEDEEKGD